MTTSRDMSRVFGEELALCKPGWREHVCPGCSVGFCRIWRPERKYGTFCTSECLWAWRVGRAWGNRQTHCKRGHELAVHASIRPSGKRQCRICAAANRKRSRDIHNLPTYFDWSTR